MAVGVRVVSVAIGWDGVVDSREGWSHSDGSWCCGDNWSGGNSMVYVRVCASLGRVRVGRLASVMHLLGLDLLRDSREELDFVFISCKLINLSSRLSTYHCGWWLVVDLSGSHWN